VKYFRGRGRREYWFEEGCWITEWANAADDEAMSVVRARVPPGGLTRWHALDGLTERYVLLEGAGRAEVADRRIDVTVGDVVVIEPGEAQRIANTGESDLVFLAICTPRFRPEAYRDLEPQ
jgi:mannose-6-phosphate isomerase-like protein (cupin superfamily)